MKKNKKVLLVVLVILISLLLFACENSQAVLTDGQWKYTDEYFQVLSENTTGDYETLKQVFGKAVLTFNEDGTYIIDFGGLDETDTDDLNEEGTYVVNNNTVIMSPVNDEARECRVDKDKIYEGTYSVYEKIK